MIIGVSGKAGSGKDTVADHLVEKHGFVKVALADPMKRFCMEVFDFTEEQLWGSSEKRNALDLRFCRAQRENDDPNDIRDIIENVEPAKPYTGDRLNYLTPRYALQTLGTEWGRNCYNDVWVDYALRVAKKLASGEHIDLRYDPRRGLYWLPDHREWEEANRRERDMPKGVVISDIRFKNELAAVKKVGKVVQVVRAGAGLEGAAGTHQSESEQDGFKTQDFDHVIINQTTVETLFMKVDQMMAHFSGRIVPYDEEKKDIPPFKR